MSDEIRCCASLLDFRGCGVIETITDTNYPQARLKVLRDVVVVSCSRFPDGEEHYVTYATNEEFLVELQEANCPELSFEGYETFFVLTPGQQVDAYESQRISWEVRITNRDGRPHIEAVSPIA